MFDKYGFNNLLILAFVLVFALGANFNHYNGSYDIYFGKELLALSIILIGAYGIFIENELIKTTTQVQALIIALVSEYYAVSTLKYFASVQHHIYFDYAYVILVALSYFLSTKYFAFTELFFRFCFVYSTGIAISNFIPPYVLPHGNVASLILAIIGIFFKYLNYRRISILCSVYTFSLMILYGTAYFLSIMINNGWFGYNPYYFEGLEIVLLVVFLYTSYQQLKSSNDIQYLAGEGQDYSTFSNSSQHSNAVSV